MATKEESSERLRVSVPKVDASVLQWWKSQHDVSLSVRMLIRAEIERNGYVDTAYQPVVQQPRRGRRPSEQLEENDEDTRLPAPAAPSLAAPTHVASPAPAPTPVPAGVGADAGFSPIDSIMNG